MMQGKNSRADTQLQADDQACQADLEALRLELERRGVRVTLANMLKANDAAAYLGVAPKTLRNWRFEGMGPEYRVIGGGVFYPLAELVAFIECAGNRPTRPAPSRSVLDSAPRKAQAEATMQIRKSTLRVNVPAAVATTIRNLARRESITVSDILSEALRAYPPVMQALLVKTNPSEETK